MKLFKAVPIKYIHVSKAVNETSSSTLITIAAQAGAKAGASLGVKQAMKSGATAGAEAGAMAGEKAGAEAGAIAAKETAMKVATKTLREALVKIGTFNKPVRCYLGIQWSSLSILSLALWHDYA